MTWFKTFAAVASGSVAGMAMGGAFGWGAGRLTPDFFQHLIPWQDVEPVGFATFLGATVGVVLGGGLACFAVLLQAVFSWRKRGTKSDG
ncbi:MAG: hypothetical protein ACOYMN_23815 [Roseimicrobium sp.]